MNKREVLLDSSTDSTSVQESESVLKPLMNRIELSDLVRVLGCQQWKLTPANQSRII